MSDGADQSYSYDQVPYPSNPFRQTHPDRLATIGHLFGIQAGAIDGCRVLEIGCAGGGNLVPMAEQLPDSRFVGIDLSQVHIDQARQFAERAGIRNLEFQQKSILDVGPELGQFDYILCHGVYSWVPAAVQDKILQVCSANLTPRGIAYVSYNTYPGWHMRGMIRDMMCFHTSKFTEAGTRIRQARNLLDFMVKHAPQNSAFGMHLKSESELLRNHSDAYLFHEHLEDCNYPTYFFQFAQKAAGQGLQYLGEADLASMYSGHLPAEARQTLERVAADLIQMEQYVDFLRNRLFRQTLLCHRDVVIDRELKPAALASLHVASPLAPTDPKMKLTDTQPVKFQHPGNNMALTTTTPFMKAALVILAEAWPGSVPFPRLVSLAASRIFAGPVLSAERLQKNSEELSKSLFECYLTDMVEFHSRPPCFQTTPGERPLASRVARIQVESGNKGITNLRHESGLLNDVCRHVLKLLDGSRDRASLLDALHQLVESQVLVVHAEGQAIIGRQLVGDRLEKTLDQALTYLACNAMLLT